MKVARNDKIYEFCRLPNFRVAGVTGRWNHPRSQKPCTIADESGQKWQNSRVLSTSSLPSTGGHGPLKSSPEPKTVCYSSWKRPEMTKFTSLVGAEHTFKFTKYSYFPDKPITTAYETIYDKIASCHTVGIQVYGMGSLQSYNHMYQLNWNILQSNVLYSVTLK